MARSWAGFDPQNQDIREQWGLMEASEAFMHALLAFPKQSEEPADNGEGTDVFAGWPYETE